MAGGIRSSVRDSAQAPCYLRCVASVTSFPTRPATFAFLSARFSLSVFEAAVLLDDFLGDLSDTGDVL